ncbi:MAG: aldose 1-epimerase family protein [Planctomycetaceae bacterium]|jgi:galactose mutarotase-like enzyme|nr:aldose 1-epimerase family protein [Planctomycetaceae bacterium]MBT6485072.1 aldose 1-epimerase family protein [Planctomycetaceae bacterium]MBT6497627.1 aldose 1-epimerase family protein [Planctomycetaceae bacterium]
MADTSIVLTDVASGVWLDSWSLCGADGPTLAGSGDWSINKRTLRGGLSDGVDIVEVNNGAFSIQVLPTRGMGLWKADYLGTQLGWNSPVSMPVNPAYVNQESRDGLGWLSGFNELLCRCGLAFNGPPGVDVRVDSDGNSSETPTTLHGHIANTPAHHVEVKIDDDGPGVISVTGIVDEASMFGSHLQLKSTLTTAAGSNRLTITDEITNLSAGAAELELLYHTNFGRPFLEAGARFVAAVRELAPRNQRAADGIEDWQTFGPPKTGFEEQVYFLEPATDENGNTIAMLHNAAGDLGVSLSFNVAQLPCFSIWKNTQAEADGFVTGLEPSTDFPNPRTFEREQQRIVTLPAGGSHVAELQIAVHNTADSVAETQRAISAIQGDLAPIVHGKPHARFSPIDD